MAFNFIYENISGFSHEYSGYLTFSHMVNIVKIDSLTNQNTRIYKEKNLFFLGCISADEKETAHRPKRIQARGFYGIKKSPRIAERSF